MLARFLIALLALHLWVTLPATRNEVEAVLGRLPASIAGSERVYPVPSGSESDFLALLFGEYVLENGYRGFRLSVSAQDLASMPPGWTAAHAAVNAAQHLGKVDAQGRDGQLAWARVTEDVRSDPPGLPQLTLLLGDETGTCLPCATSSSITAVPTGPIPYTTCSSSVVIVSVCSCFLVGDLAGA